MRSFPSQLPLKDGTQKGFIISHNENTHQDRITNADFLEKIRVMTRFKDIMELSLQNLLVTRNKSTTTNC